MRALLWFLLAISAIAAACSSTPQDAVPGSAVIPEEESVVTTTTEPPNRAPELRVPSSVRADVGGTWTDAIVASDPDGDSFTIRIENAPVGFFETVTARGVVNGFEWQPVDAGTWSVSVVATDPDGLEARAEIELLARYPHSGDLLVAVGDSYAAGFGRDRTDFVAGDQCWRSEQTAYPALVFAELVDAGSFSNDAEFASSACLGASATNFRVRRTSLTNLDGALLDEEATLPQIDWVVQRNPTIVTVTLGAEDLGLFDSDAVAELDISTEVAQQRLTVFEDDLGWALDRIITATDAHVVITTYPNPAASSPIGTEDCRGTCFADATAGAWSALNATIEQVVTAQPDGRVSLVDLEFVFEGHRAGNGLGPDVLRGIDTGPFGDLLNRLTGTGEGYCSAGNGPDETWISRTDCMHPNDEGQRQIAEEITSALFAL